MKSALKFLIVVVIIAVISLVVYFLWRGFAGEEAPPAAPEGHATSTPSFTIPPAETPGGAASEASEGSGAAVRKMSDREVFAFWVNPAVNEVYYLTPEGIVMRIDEGEDAEISHVELTGLQSAEASPSSEKVLARFGDQKAPQWGVFDSIDGVWRPLPATVAYAVWGASDWKIIAVVKNGSGLALAELDLQKSAATPKILVKDFRFKNVSLQLVPPQRLMIVERPALGYAGAAWELTLGTLALKTALPAAIPGTMARWIAGTGTSSLVLAYDPVNEFSILNGALQNITPPFFTTLPSKCTRILPLYCFAPREAPANVAMPDSYLRGVFHTTDELFLVDAAGGDVTSLMQSGAGGIPALDAAAPALSGRALYFINRYDHGLYRFTIPAR